MGFEAWMLTLLPLVVYLLAKDTPFSRLITTRLALLILPRKQANKLIEWILNP